MGFVNPSMTARQELEVRCGMLSLPKNSAHHRFALHWSAKMAGNMRMEGEAVPSRLTGLAFSTRLFLPVAVLLVYSAAAQSGKPDKSTRAAGHVRGQAGTGEVARLRQTIHRRVDPAAFTCEPGAVPRASTTLTETWLALAAVQVEKAADYLARSVAGRRKAEVALGLARRLVAERDPEAPPRLVRHGSLLEHAYFARNDGSPQPYFVYVPTTYAGSKAFPMVIFLHGWVPGTSRTDPWLPDKNVIRMAERHGAILVAPHGRTNTDFQYAGEMDVLRVKAEMEKLYRVDPDRVYLIGVSMGGAGAWQIGAHYPHLFAGVAPVSAQGDWFKFWHDQFGYPERDGLPKPVAWLLAMHNPVDLAPNFLNLYSYSQHGTQCFLGAEHTKQVVAELRDAGAPHDFYEDPGPFGHYIYWDPRCWERVFERLMPRVRARHPERIRYSTRSLRFREAYWVAVERIQSWGKPASVDARYAGKGLLGVETENITSLTLTPPHDWCDQRGAFRVVWNGKRLAEPIKPDAAGRLTLGPADRAAPAFPPRKSVAVCGPAHDVLNFPFVLVRGTAGNAQENTVCEALTTRFAHDWKGYAEGEARIIRDVDVTDELMRGRGLVLFGWPRLNTVTARIKKSLPFTFTRKEVRLPDGRAFDRDKVGLVMAYPNPLAPHRYVMIVAGIPWGTARAANHKFDLLPDFALFTDEIVPAMNINRFVAAGLFDEQWRYGGEKL